MPKRRQQAAPISAKKRNACGPVEYKAADPAEPEELNEIIKTSNGRVLQIV